MVRRISTTATPDNHYIGNTVQANSGNKKHKKDIPSKRCTKKSSVAS